jgi:redox-sensitive bicupin YhaK (pirin superfamily)
MDGFPIKQPFPTNNVEQIDPFLLLHHADVEVPTDRKPKHSGVGPHPHRGFSPVTFIFKGAVHHRDSRGNDSVVYAGGAQWMNSGMGVMHSERPSDDIHEIGGRQEIIQLWINTPAKHKMDQPQYFPVQPDEVKKFVSDDGKITVNVFAGEVLGVKGTISSQTAVNASTIEAKAGGTISIPIPKDYNAFLYLLDGKISIDGYGLTEGLNAAVFANDGEGISFKTIQDTRLLLMSGKPLNEKVVAQGPFVMNNETQILEAMRDYRLGKMGILIED